jgi:copper homeostasis protein
LLEVCIASVEDAVGAAAGGADRLELNAALPLGGLTPSLGTLLEVKQAVGLPVLVMVRPRPGGFAYDDREFQVMRRDADLALQAGADGIVFGVLTENGEVDVERCQRLVAQAGDREAVFHRAFDFTPDPLAALEQLIDLGVKRVLTSGQAETALRGADLIAELVRRAAGRIEVLPGGGINRHTVAELVVRTGCTQVHASLRQRRADRSTAARPHVALAAALPPADDGHHGTNQVAVAELRALLSRLNAAT